MKFDRILEISIWGKLKSTFSNKLINIFEQNVEMNDIFFHYVADVMREIFVWFEIQNFSIFEWKFLFMFFDVDQNVLVNFIFQMIASFILNNLPTEKWILQQLLFMLCHSFLVSSKFYLKVQILKILFSQRTNFDKTKSWHHFQKFFCQFWQFEVNILLTLCHIPVTTFWIIRFVTEMLKFMFSMSNDYVHLFAKNVWLKSMFSPLHNYWYLLYLWTQVLMTQIREKFSKTFDNNFRKLTKFEILNTF